MARRLVVTEQLPDRSKEDTFTRQRMKEADIKEAMLLAQKRLTDVATQHHVTGWDMSQDDIEYDIVGRVIVASVVLTRRGS